MSAAICPRNIPDDGEKKLVDFARAKLHVYADVLKESQRRTLHITMGPKVS